MKVYKISPNGLVSTLYHDALPPLGKASVGRASNVEPNPAGGWDVVLTNHPLNGKHKGRVLARAVPKRQDALDLEVNWINRNILGPKKGT